MGFAPGSFAEFALGHPDKLVRKPAGLSFVESAAAPVSGLTALQAIRDEGRLQPGQKVLVIGAAGGVGTFAVQTRRHSVHTSPLCAVLRKRTWFDRSARTR